MKPSRVKPAPQSEPGPGLLQVHVTYGGTGAHFRLNFQKKMFSRISIKSEMRRAASSSEYVWLLSNFINTKLWGTIHVEASNAEMMHSQHANVLIK